MKTNILNMLCQMARSPPCFILKTFFVWHLLLETGSHLEKINFGKIGEVLNYINIVKNQLSSLSRHYQKGLNSCVTLIPTLGSSE